MGEHALERLEKWLAGDVNRMATLDSVSKETRSTSLFNTSKPDVEVFEIGPELEFVMHAALDRAEEAGL